MIKWRGTGYVRTIGKYIIAGKGWGQIELTSDQCKDGKRLTAKFDVDFWPFGLGTPSEDRFDIVIEDYQEQIDFNNLVGNFDYRSLGGNIFGADQGVTRIRMGENGLAERVETTGGLGAGFTGTISGTSKLTSDKYPYYWKTSSECECGDN